MKIYHLFPALLLVGCAHSNPPITAGDPGPLPERHSVPDTSSVRSTERIKAYPIGRYEDPSDPNVMHEGHTVYRAESSPEWDTDPNEPTSLPLGPGEMATADPCQQHVALTAELEQRLKQEEQLLQISYEQNERIAQELQAQQDKAPHVRLPDPQPVQQSPVATPKSKSKAASSPSPQNLNSSPTTTPRTWGQWFQSVWFQSAPPQSSNPKEK